LIYKKDFADFAGRTIEITELQNMTQGLYLLRVKTGSEMNVLKIIKLKK
jgi:hypothetical protein